MKREIILTCEHASRDIPSAYRSLFRGHDQTLDSHRAYDPNALELATLLAARLNCDLFQGTVSRLLVELNRSLTHRSLFSEITRTLSETEKQQLLTQYYFPYRTAVERRIRSDVKQGLAVLHLGIHTFTPILDEKTRIADVGLLFDPTREQEARLMQAWRRVLVQQVPELRIRKNYPYRGYSDGLTTDLRTRFAGHEYLGIEIEVRNDLCPSSKIWTRLASSFETLARGYVMAGC